MSDYTDTDPGVNRVVSLKDVRERIEVEAKRSGGTPADIFKEMFGNPFGFPSGPFDEAVKRQQSEAAMDAAVKRNSEMLAAANKPIVDVLNRFANIIDRQNDNMKHVLAQLERAVAQNEELVALLKPEDDR